MKINRLPKAASMVILMVIIAFLAADVGSIASAGETTHSCCNISLADAAGILDVPSQDLQKHSRELMLSPEQLKKNIYKKHPCSCSIREKGNFLKIIAYRIYEYNKPRQAHMDFEQMKQGFASCSTVDVVPDLGDEAFWAGDKRFRRLVAVQKNVMIDVSNPSDFELNRKIIRLVLAGLQLKK